MGSIVKRGLKYMAIVRLGEYKYRPIKSTLPTKNLAKQFILDTEHKILNNKYQRTTTYPTLPELIHRYLKEVTPRKSYFVQQYENYCLKLFLREFKQSRLKVNLLTTPHLGV
jgi:6-pyruvoyl-tetrahydropterin synthase